MEARVRLLELEDHRVGVGRLHRGDVVGQHGAESHARVLDLRVDRPDHVGCGELDAVAPVDALPELHGHLGEVGVVGRLVGGERVVPHALDPALRIDVPERIERGLLKPVGLAASIDGPDVEPARVLDRPFRILQDQGLVARNILRNSLRIRLVDRSPRMLGAKTHALSSNARMRRIVSSSMPESLCSLKM